MAQFEEKHIYPIIKDMSLLYLRYIDDVFIIWKGTEEQLITFIIELNKKDKTIKFEDEISLQKIPFLDTMVYKDKDNNLQTTLYCKPIDQQSYLHAKSEHSSALKNSIAYSQTLRVKIIFSTEDEYQRNCAVMKQKLLERKYNKDNVNRQINKFDLSNEKNFCKIMKKITARKKIPLLLTYNRALPNISEVVRKNWHILVINPEFCNVFVTKPKKSI